MLVEGVDATRPLSTLDMRARVSSLANTGRGQRQGRNPSGGICGEHFLAWRGSGTYTDLYTDTQMYYS
jgi:hypothetical protein